MFVPFFIAFYGSGGSIRPDTLQMNPYRENNDVKIANDCSIEGKNGLQINSKKIDTKSNQNQKDDIDYFLKADL